MRALVVAFVLLIAGIAYGQMTPAKLSAIADSTVRIETATGYGSGTAIGDGRVLTCAHVVKDATSVLVETWLHDGKTEVLMAHVVKLDVPHDLALLEVRSLTVPAVKVAARDAEEFSTLWLVSSPLGKRRSVSAVILNTADADAGMWRLTGPAMHGSSGGGVVDANGELQCVFQVLWGWTPTSSGVMSECVDRATVKRFLTSAHAR